MKQLYLLLLFICLYPAAIIAQEDTNRVVRDTLPKDTLKRDTLKPKPVVPRVRDTSNARRLQIIQVDSLKIKDSLRVLDSIKLAQQQITDSIQKKLEEEKRSQLTDLKEGEKKTFIGKELLFYYLVLLLLLFGLLRRAFAKYFHDLFRVFFRTTLKQRQTQEQLLQSSLPSVLLNTFFVLSAGLYLNFILTYFNLSITSNFWLQYGYCAAALAIIYVVKFLGLKLTGWVFNVSNATDAYIFVVFIVNKVLGIFLLPFLLLLAFTTEPLYGSAIYLSWFGIGLLLIYRFILSYAAIRKEVKLNSFHFVLYILSFEVVPLLLIYKLLLLIF
ncbi:MAG TPA: DUF4271 domain-containing protein [Chitinophagaceae bacterium]|nr:DUF4271 domain-containing protein [Chitinophagaceae bacterium]